MENNLFNEQMNGGEIRDALFRAVDGKTKEEREKILAEYHKVLTVILKRENELAAEGWMFSY